MVLFSGCTWWDAHGHVTIVCTAFLQLPADGKVSVTSKPAIAAADGEGFLPTDPGPHGLWGWVGGAESAVEVEQCVCNWWVDLQPQWPCTVPQYAGVSREVVGQWAVAGRLGGDQRGQTAPAGVASDIDVHNVKVLVIFLEGDDVERCGEVSTGGGLQSHLVRVNRQVDKGPHSALSHNQKWSNY